MRSKAKKGKSKKKKVEVKVYEMPAIFKKVERIPEIIKEPLNNAEFMREIKDQIDIYEQNVKNKVYNNQDIENEEFRSPFMEKVKKLYYKAVKIENQYEKSVQIQNLWNWFTYRVDSYYDTFKIKKRTKQNQYELLDNINTDYQSEYFSSKQIPKAFEFGNRTQDLSILPAKDRIKDFLTKHVSNYVDEKANENRDRIKALIFESKLKEKEKASLFQSVHSSTILSQANTNFKPKKKDFVTKVKSNLDNNSAINAGNTSINSNNNKDSKLINEESKENNYIQIISNPPKFQKEIGSLREIKSSYSLYRPKYESISLLMERKYLIDNNRELAEKRNLMEHKEYIDKWGRAKSNYKKAMDEKHSVLKLLNDLDNQLKNSNVIDRNTVKSAFSNYRPNITYSNVEENTKQDKEKTKTFKVTEKTEQIEKTIAENDALVDLEEGELLIPDKPLLKDERINTKRILSSFAINQSLVNSKNKKLREEANKSIQLKNKSLLNSKADKLQSVKNSEIEKFPSEFQSDLRQLDKVFDARLTYSRLIEVSKIDNAKSHYTSHITPLSAFDKKHLDYEKYSNEYKLQEALNKVKQRPSTGVEMLRSKNYNSYNLLEMANKLKEYNHNLVQEVKNHQMKGTKIVKVTDMQDKFLVKSDKAYHKFYLPVSTATLLEKPKDKIVKKKKKVVAKRRW